jgi:hypothetical protein
MKIDQEEEIDLLKIASIFYAKFGATPPWCTQDLKIHIFDDFKL